jgi:hypothetical protein
MRRNSAEIRFPSGVRGPACWGFAFDPDARSVSEHSMLRSGEWALRHGPVEVDPCEPRARRSPARGCTQPSSEAESHPRGRPALERGGVSPEGASSPRARQSFGVTAPGPSSEAEFCPRCAGAGCLQVLTQNLHLTPSTQQAEKSWLHTRRDHKTCQSIFPEN